jgi:hypothetical protein
MAKCVLQIHNLSSTIQRQGVLTWFHSEKAVEYLVLGNITLHKIYLKLFFYFIKVKKFNCLLNILPLNAIAALVLVFVKKRATLYLIVPLVHMILYKYMMVQTTPLH